MYKDIDFSHNIPYSKYENKSREEILSIYKDIDPSKYSPDISGECVSIIDANTISIQRTIDPESGLTENIKFRLSGINAPRQNRDGHYTSQKVMEKLCLGEIVYIDIDNQKEKDEYGRNFGVIIINNKNLNEVLAKEGLARVSYIPPTDFNPEEWRPSDEDPDDSPTTNTIKLPSTIINQKKKLFFYVTQSKDLVWPNSKYAYQIYVKNISGQIINNLKIYITNPREIIIKEKKEGEYSYKIPTLKTGQSVLININDCTITKEGYHNVSFIAMGNGTEIKTQSLLIKCGYENDNKNIQHKISFYNFTPYESAYMQKASDFDEEKTQLVKVQNKPFEAYNQPFEIGKLELDLYAQDDFLSNTDDMPLMYLGRENWEYNSGETFEGQSLINLIQQINKESDLVTIDYLGAGNNEMETDFQQLYPNGFIHRFGLLRSEFYKLLGIIPKVYSINDRLFRWGRTETDWQGIEKPPKIYPERENDVWDQKPWCGIGYYVYEVKNIDDREEFSEIAIFTTKDDAEAYVEDLKTYNELFFIENISYSIRREDWVPGIFYVEIPLREIPANFLMPSMDEIQATIELAKPYGLKGYPRFNIYNSFNHQMSFSGTPCFTPHFHFDLGDYMDIDYHIRGKKYQNTGDGIELKEFGLQAERIHFPMPNTKFNSTIPHPNIKKKCSTKNDLRTFFDNETKTKNINIYSLDYKDIFDPTKISDDIIKYQEIIGSDIEVLSFFKYDLVNTIIRRYANFINADIDDLENILIFNNIDIDSMNKTEYRKFIINNQESLDFVHMPDDTFDKLIKDIDFVIEFINYYFILPEIDEHDLSNNIRINLPLSSADSYMKKIKTKDFLQNRYDEDKFLVAINKYDNSISPECLDSEIPVNPWACPVMRIEDRKVRSEKEQKFSTRDDINEVLIRNPEDIHFYIEDQDQFIPNRIQPEQQPLVLPIRYKTLDYYDEKSHIMIECLSDNVDNPFAIKLQKQILPKHLNINLLFKDINTDKSNIIGYNLLHDNVYSIFYKIYNKKETIIKEISTKFDYLLIQIDKISPRRDLVKIFFTLDDKMHFVTSFNAYVLNLEENGQTSKINLYVSLTNDLTLPSEFIFSNGNLMIGNIDTNSINNWFIGNKSYSDMISTDDYSIKEFANSEIKWENLYRINKDEKSFAIFENVIDEITDINNLELFCENLNIPVNSIIDNIYMDIYADSRERVSVFSQYQVNANAVNACDNICGVFDMNTYSIYVKYNLKYLEQQLAYYIDMENEKQIEIYKNLIDIFYKQNQNINVDFDEENPLRISNNYWNEATFKNTEELQSNSAKNIYLILEGYNRSNNVVIESQLIRYDGANEATETNVGSGYFYKKIPIKYEKSYNVQELTIRFRFNNVQDIKLYKVKSEIEFMTPQNISNEYIDGEEIFIDGLDKYSCLIGKDIDGDTVRDGLAVKLNFGQIHNYLKIYSIVINITYHEKAFTHIIETSSNFNTISGDNKSGIFRGNVFDEKISDMRQDSYTTKRPNGEYDAGFEIDSRIYQSFTAEEDNLTSIELKPNGKVGSPSTRIKIAILDNYENLPNNIIKEITVDMDEEEVLDDEAYKFNICVNDLKIGDTYWFSIEPVDMTMKGAYRFLYNNSQVDDFKLLKAMNGDIINQHASLYFRLYSKQNNFGFAELPFTFETDNEYTKNINLITEIETYNANIKNLTLSEFSKHVDPNIRLSVEDIFYGEKPTVIINADNTFNEVVDLKIKDRYSTFIIIESKIKIDNGMANITIGTIFPIGEYAATVSFDGNDEFSEEKETVYFKVNGKT